MTTEPKKVISEARKINSVARKNKAGVVPMFSANMPQSPRIIFTTKAWEQMYTLIPLAKKMNTEVTWYAPLIHQEDTSDRACITVPEIFVPDQVVASATCEDCEWGKVLDEAYEKGYDLDTMRGWFHLHPMVSVEPSATDEEQTQDMIEEWDTLMRGIFNDAGGYKLDYFDANAGPDGTIYHDLPIEIHAPEEFELDRITQNFKDRVKKKVYAPVNNFQNSQGNQKKSTQTSGATGGGNVSSLYNQLDFGDVDDQDDDSTIDWFNNGNGFDDTPSSSIQDKHYFCDVGGVSVYASHEEVLLLGEDADLLYYDATNLGITIAGALKSESVTIEDIVGFIQTIPEIKEDDLPENWSGLMRAIDAQEQYLADLEENNSQAAN